MPRASQRPGDTPGASLFPAGSYQQTLAPEVHTTGETTPCQHTV
jgi:hypothetical protein